jgi:hypothetical protein
VVVIHLRVTFRTCGVPRLRLAKRPGMKSSEPKTNEIAAAITRAAGQCECDGQHCSADYHGTPVAKSPGSNPILARCARKIESTPGEWRAKLVHGVVLLYCPPCYMAAEDP